MPFLKTTLTAGALLFGGLVASTPETAEAQGRFSYYRNGHGYNSSYRDYGWSGHRAYGNYGHSGRLGSHYGHRWHDTSHYDWHPTTIVPHGNHYHVQPGHYDFHRQGHWDHYGH